MVCYTFIMLESITCKLFSLADHSYKAFHASLMPTISADTIIGVRVPLLREYAKELYKSGEYGAFLHDLPHRYYEENNLHAFIISLMPYEDFLKEIDLFLPYINNWATCDCLKPKCIKGNEQDFVSKIYEWLSNEHEYTVRFGISMLLSYYLDEHFKEEYLERVSNVRSEKYYINMMIAWYFATALAKKYDTTLPYLLERKLPVWIHNKTIQKAVESYRITPNQKDFLKTLKIKTTRGKEN